MHKLTLIEKKSLTKWKIILCVIVILLKDAGWKNIKLGDIMEVQKVFIELCLIIHAYELNLQQDLIPFLDVVLNGPIEVKSYINSPMPMHFFHEIVLFHCKVLLEVHGIGVES